MKPRSLNFLCKKKKEYKSQCHIWKNKNQYELLLASWFWWLDELKLTIAIFLVLLCLVLNLWIYAPVASFFFILTITLQVFRTLCFALVICYYTSNLRLLQVSCTCCVWCLDGYPWISTMYQGFQHLSSKNFVLSWLLFRVPVLNAASCDFSLQLTIFLFCVPKHTGWRTTYHCWRSCNNFSPSVCCLPLFHGTSRWIAISLSFAMEEHFFSGFEHFFSLEFSNWNVVPY